jgi:hypothetical protein
VDTERSTPGRRRIIQSDEDDIEEIRTSPVRARPRSSVSATPDALARSDIAEAVSMSNEPLEVQKLQAELEVAEAELKAARLKYQYIQAKEVAERNRAQSVEY